MNIGKLSFVFLALIMSIGFASAGYHYSYYAPQYNDYRNTYYGSVFPEAYHSSYSYSSYSYYTYTSSNYNYDYNYRNNYYTFNIPYDREISYRALYPMQMGCDSYHAGHGCNAAYYPVIYQPY